MATKASGKEYIEHKAYILENIGKHFNNPEASDVTLKVGNQEFAAHRFLLSTQSKVFMTMLMGENWKESEDKVITLQESPEAEAVFSDFLQFIYTGKLTLTIDNVCGIHTLADKYDVDVLKDDCVSFMKDVLTGIHGDALMAGLKWLQYAESVLQDMVALCYSAIRSNFVQIHLHSSGKGNTHRELFESRLTFEQVKNILSVPEVGEELVSYNEHGVYVVVKKWGEGAFPLVRFYNMDTDIIQSKEHVYYLQGYCSEAYKIQAERCNIASKGAKRRRLSQDPVDVTCPCTKSSTSQLQVCPHINPRLYLTSPYGNRIGLKKGSCILVCPVDLTDLEGFTQKLLYMDDSSSNSSKTWGLQINKVYSQDPVYETFTVTPDVSHVGRKYTIAICCMLMDGTKFKKTEYVIRQTGEVRSVVTNAFTLTSPQRFKGSWKLSDHNSIYVTILLHK